MAWAAGTIPHFDQQVLPSGHVNSLHSKMKLMGKQLWGATKGKPFSRYQYLLTDQMFLILRLESWSSGMANNRVSLQMEVRKTNTKHWRIKHTHSTHIHNMSLATWLFLSSSSGIQYNLKRYREFKQFKKYIPASHFNRQNILWLEPTEHFPIHLQSECPVHCKVRFEYLSLLFP